MREVQVDRGLQILPLLAERIRQLGETADAHPHREVLTLDMGLGDVIGIGIEFDE